MTKPTLTCESCEDERPISGFRDDLHSVNLVRIGKAFVIRVDHGEIERSKAKETL